jgi:hypothetical protein
MVDDDKIEANRLKQMQGAVVWIKPVLWPDDTPD